MVETQTHVALAHLMVLIDVVCAIVLFYVAIFISKNYGHGGLDDKLKWIHRLTILAMSFGLAWHAKDIAVAPQAHGLAPSNFFLHIGMVLCFTIGALRFHISKAAQLGRDRQYKNGDAIAGPFSR